MVNGNKITPICFDKAMDFSNERALVMYNRRYGYINRNKILTDPKNLDEYAENLVQKFLNATSFRDGLATAIITPSNHFKPSRRVKIDITGAFVEFISPARVLMKRKLRQQGKLIKFY